MTNSGFPRASRLLDASDFETVFNENQFKVSNRYFLILTLKTEHCSRLGIVVAKKNIGSAVQRNRIKRLIRESFRLSNERPENHDIVVLARKGLDQLPNADIMLNLNRLWRDLSSKITIKASSGDEGTRKSS